MPLTNTQYAKIKRDYDYINSVNEKIRKERLEEIERLSPEYNAVYNEIGELSRRAALAALGSKPGDPSDYKDKMEGLKKKQCDILESLGKPADYLDPVYNCELCHDTGVADGKRCICFKKKAIELIYNDSNLRNITDGVTLDSFDLSNYSDDVSDASGKTPFAYAKEALAAARHFTDNFDSEHNNIFIYGNTGVGKTFLSSCIAGELIGTTHSVVYITALDLFEKLEEYDEYSPILECDLLIIDDLGTELSNSFTNSKLFYCINERLLRKKSTIISTNLSLGEVEAIYTERVYSRIVSSYMLMRLTGEDLRTKKLYS